MQQENVKAKLWSVCAVDEREREREDVRTCDAESLMLSPGWTAAAVCCCCCCCWCWEKKSEEPAGAAAAAPPWLWWRRPDRGEIRRCISLASILSILTYLLDMII